MSAHSITFGTWFRFTIATVGAALGGPLSLLTLPPEALALFPDIDGPTALVIVLLAGPILMWTIAGRAIWRADAKRRYALSSLFANASVASISLTFAIGKTELKGIIVAVMAINAVMYSTRAIMRWHDLRTGRYLSRFVRRERQSAFDLIRLFRAEARLATGK